MNHDKLKKMGSDFDQEVDFNDEPPFA